MLDRLAAAWDLPPVRVTIDRTIPAHAGLGSGTQLALALGVAAGEARGPRRHRAQSRRPAPARQPLGHRHRRLRAGRLHPRRRQRRRRSPAAGHRAAGLPRGLAHAADLRSRPAKGCTAPARTAPFASCRPTRPSWPASLCRLVVMRLLPGLADGRSRRGRPGHRRDPARGRRLFRPGPERPLHQPGGERGAGLAGGARDRRRRPELLGADRLRDPARRGQRRQRCAARRSGGSAPLTRACGSWSPAPATGAPRSTSA